jgi:hypothetical protein
MSATIIVSVCEATPAANFKAPSLSALLGLINSCTSAAFYGWFLNGSDEHILEPLLCKPFGKQPRIRLLFIFLVLIAYKRVKIMSEFGRSSNLWS